jgi:protein-S-isoprenylcysteine O-methyltransferase
MAVNILIFAAVFLLPPLLAGLPRVLHPGPCLGFVAALATLATQPSLSANTLIHDQGDRRSALVILVAAVLSQLAAAVDFALRDLLFPSPMSWWVIVGFTLIVIGLALRLWAIHTLGEFFTSTVRVRDGQRVLSHGPYRVVRHPSYTGTLLTLTGIALALGSVIGLVMIICVNVPAYLYRIRIEEDALLAGLGPEYARYRAITWRLVPYVM